ncbi:MAG: helix-turn-helix transcriptional regulator [Candidatus Odinarchaeota archaeon]|nr:helix-turn-helix transcriptional regulator [Candidatus Odinarchaeota archaeon]
MIFVSKDDPTRARYVIDALSDKNRLEILKLLIENPNGLTAAQIARVLNKTIPTNFKPPRCVDASKFTEYRLSTIQRPCSQGIFLSRQGN